MTTEGFHRFVDASAGPDACWPWTGSFNPWGYGRARIVVDGRTVEVTASRAAYIAANGPLTSSVHVLHSCDNRPCCNPRHLRAGSHLENMADRKARGNYKRGAECPVALQIAPELIAQIRAAYRPGVAGCGTPALARRFGLSRTTVQRIVTGSDRWAAERSA